MKYRHYTHNYVLDPPHELTVNVIGCGGTGSQVLTSLGRMNYALRKLGHPGLLVTAYDGDIVTEANCGRQLFSEQEIGRSKSEVLVTKLNMFFGTKWDSVPEMYGENSETANITISCVDTVQARKEIGFRLKQCGLYDRNSVEYWMDFGNTVDGGQVIIGTAGRNHEQPANRRKCVGFLPSVNDMFDLSKVSDRKSGPSCSLAEALTRQDLFVNSTLANVGMSLLWNFFKGVVDIHGAYVNLRTMNVNPIKVGKHE